MVEESFRARPDHIGLLLSVIVPILFGTVFIFNCIYSIREPIWGQRNELAHFDYIYKLSTFNFPGNADSISPYSFELTHSGFQWKRPTNFDGSIEGMGIEGISYEAQQPPLYYTIMAFAEGGLRWLDLAPITHIQILRVIHLLIATLGIALLIPIFRQINTIWSVAPIYGWLMASATCLFTAKEFITLGNDAFSPMIGNGAILTALLAIQTKRPAYIIIASMMPALAFLTKYTNGLYLIMHLFVALFWFYKDRDFSRTFKTGILLFPLIIVLSYIALNIFAYGDPLKSNSTMETFSHTHGTKRDFSRFLPVFLMTSFRLNHVGIMLPQWISQAFLAMLALNILVPASRLYRGDWRGWDGFVFSVSVFVGGLLTLAYLLNLYHSGVWWSAFRHFSGYYFFWMLAAFHIPFNAPERYRNLIPLLATIFLTVLIIRYGFLLQVQ